MEPNLRDTPIRRFNTFWWGLALFVVFGIACFFIRNFVQSDEVSDADTARGIERLAKKAENDKAQAEIMDAKIKPSALFPDADQHLNYIPMDAGVPHNKTFK